MDWVHLSWPCLTAVSHLTGSSPSWVPWGWAPQLSPRQAPHGVTPQLLPAMGPAPLLQILQTLQENMAQDGGEKSVWCYRGKIKLSHARNWRKKNERKNKKCYFKSSTLRRLYSARCLSTIWLEKFKRLQQTAEYLQTGNEPTFGARARNTLSKQPVFLAPKTSETMGWRMEFYVCKAFSELA